MLKFSNGHNSRFMDEVFGKTRQKENDVETAKYEPIMLVKNEVSEKTSLCSFILQQSDRKRRFESVTFIVINTPSCVFYND